MRIAILGAGIVGVATAYELATDGHEVVVIDRQDRDRFFSGTWGRTEGTRRDPVLGVIQTDRTTIHMVDDDGTFLGILAEPDAMEVCRTEVTAVSRNVGCAEFTRRR